MTRRDHLLRLFKQARKAKVKQVRIELLCRIFHEITPFRAPRENTWILPGSEPFKTFRIRPVAQWRAFYVETNDGWRGIEDIRGLSCLLHLAGWLD